MKTTRLYRPTGKNELKLVAESGFKRWPARLPEQPIFYPVTNEEYAVDIATQWNAKDGKTGFVTAFDVETEYLAQFPIEQVGGERHTEYWIPAERLEEFNDHIEGTIDVIRKFNELGELTDLSID